MGDQHAFIGLGAMGQGMALNLASKGHLKKPLIVWNRTESKATQLAETLKAQNGSSVEIAKSPIDAISRAHVVWSCLYDQQAADNVWFDAAANIDLNGTTVVECSTMSGAGTIELARRIEAAGGQFVAMPVVGPPELARAGKLICITSGKADVVHRIKPFIEGVIGKTHIDLSDHPVDMALRLKLCQNLFSLTVAQQLAEFYTLAEKCGVGVDNGQKLVDALFPDSPHHLFYGQQMVSGSCFDTHNIVNGVDKVLPVTTHVNAMADECGVELESYNVAVRNVEAINNRGGFMAIYGTVREKSGLPFSTSG